MTRIDKSKDGIIGPEPAGIVLSLPSKDSTPETSTNTVGVTIPLPPLKKMLKPELIELAVSKGIDVEGQTKAQLIDELEKNG